VIRSAATAPLRLQPARPVLSLGRAPLQARCPPPIEPRPSGSGKCPEYLCHNEAEGAWHLQSINRAATVRESDKHPGHLCHNEAKGAWHLQSINRAATVRESDKHPGTYATMKQKVHGTCRASIEPRPSGSRTNTPGTYATMKQMVHGTCRASKEQKMRKLTALRGLEWRAGDSSCRRRFVGERTGIGWTEKLLRTAESSGSAASEPASGTVPGSVTAGLSDS